jgi:hypothetical protein
MSSLKLKVNEKSLHKRATLVEPCAQLLLGLLGAADLAGFELNSVQCCCRSKLHSENKGYQPKDPSLEYLPQSIAFRRSALILNERFLPKHQNNIIREPLPKQRSLHLRED